MDDCLGKIMQDDDVTIITVAENDGEERQVGSLAEARKVVWGRMKKTIGADLETARAVLQNFTGKSSFHDLDAQECFDLSFLFLDENRDLLKEELSASGLDAMVPLLGQ